MLESTLLVLALVAPQEAPLPPPSAPAEELVRAVRVEAAPKEGLEAFVGLVPGRPLDREAVRRAVELMFATGRFEDVLVELRRPEGEAGVEVVFRPLLAPLLVAVRIEGDPVISPGSARSTARLRAGEPLWPSRLERAARDIALALARRGHLEALVEPEVARVPGGADAVFRVRAGPRVRVGRSRVEGAEAAAALRLDELARPRPAEVFRREKAESARDAMRRRLVGAGRWRAAVELRETYDPGRGVMDVVFHVVPGPGMSLETRGAELPRKLVSAVRDLVREGGATTDSLEAGAERVEVYLREQGHREAVVRATTEPRGPGEAVVYDLRPGPRASASIVELRDADPLLLAGLRTRPGLPIDDVALQEDARLLVSRLEERGHFEASVEPEVPEGGGILAVVFLARPGPRATVRSLEVTGPPLPPSGDGKGPPELPLRADTPYRLLDVARSRETLVSAWRRAGHLDARVRPEVTLSEAQDEASVRLVVEPGPRTVVEHLVLAGLDHTRAITVEREMVLRPAEPFSFERVLESQRRLSGLGIFERVTIAELDPGRTRLRDVVVSVQEAPRTTWSWGVGWSEQDRLRGSVAFTRRNLGGLGRTASVFARASFRGSRFLLNLREPWLFGRRLDSSATVFWEEQDRTSFDYNRKGSFVQTGRTLDSRTSLILRYVYQDTHIFNVEVPIEELDRQYRTYAVSGPSASVIFDTRDDPLEPKRGIFLSADVQLSLRALGGVSYLKGFFQATSVRRLRSDLVFVLSARLGLAGSFGGEPPLLPQPERFFAGGDYGPRGFPVDGLGPKLVGTDGQLYPTGGNAVALGGAELRYNFSRAFQLASFLDNGNVFLETRNLTLSRLRWSAGLGLRYRTPIGPVRLDWGYILDPEPGDDGRSHLNFSIGYAF
ncbi:MAG TPA: BamA/TamA family outer membrane protein [Vicinamibacteria bacterium]|nr:BamA/TamA family outer membrane protein [Vicinamibacteria bacterium]